ncbi:MAG: hypothetical protein HQK53_08245 [Oligoflexia bacterium]|nr:hypothetical protein [Oligoflexia bacterium]
MSKRKNSEIGNKTRRNINLNAYKQHLEELKKKGEEHYAPKIGRQAAQVKKKIQRLEKNIRVASNAKANAKLNVKGSQGGHVHNVSSSLPSNKTNEHKKEGN